MQSPGAWVSRFHAKKFWYWCPLSKATSSPFGRRWRMKHSSWGAHRPFLTFSMSAAFLQDGDGVSFAPATQTPHLPAVTNHPGNGTELRPWSLNKLPTKGGHSPQIWLQRLMLPTPQGSSILVLFFVSFIFSLSILFSVKIFRNTVSFWNCFSYLLVCQPYGDTSSPGRDEMKEPVRWATEVVAAF